jgi:hypothetical protein
VVQSLAQEFDRKNNQPASFHVNDTVIAPPSIRDMATDALRYWESRRLVYNGVLALVVIGYFLAYWPGSKSSVTLNSILHLFLLAVFANVLYCTAYVADGFVQLSGFRGQWSRWRWVLLLLGTAVASIVARFVVMGVLHLAP